MKQYIKKADIVLLIILVIVGLASTAFVAMSKSSGDTVLIEKNGKLFGKYSLYEDKTIVVKKTGGTAENVVYIRDGKVKMHSATCKNQVCVRHASIDSAGESIICLPNRVVVRIEGKGGGYDDISS